MNEYHVELEESTVYQNSSLSIWFDGHSTFTIYDCNMAMDSFTHPDIISMQHARDVAERYIQRTLE